MSHAIDDELRIEQAKKLMEWNQERFGEPATLEYLRSYRMGIIKEVHIEAVVRQAVTAKLREVRGKLPEMWGWKGEDGASFREHCEGRNKAIDQVAALLDSEIDKGQAPSV